MMLIDSHAHLNDSSILDDEVPKLIERAKLAGVEKIICNGGGVKSSKRAVEIAHRHGGVYATVGIHPEEKDEVLKLTEEVVREELLNLAKDPKVVAIGESGLDYFEGISSEEREIQQRIFRINIWLCEKTNLPLVIHNRNANEDILKLLKGFGFDFQMHCFVQDEEFMNSIVSMGGFISFGGILTFKKSDYLRLLADKVPADRILVETDSPYLSPEPLRGSQNEPANVKIVAMALAGARSVSFEEISKLTSANALRLFSKIK